MHPLSLTHTEAEDVVVAVVERKDFMLFVVVVVVVEKAKAACEKKICGCCDCPASCLASVVDDGFDEHKDPFASSR